MSRLPHRPRHTARIVGPGRVFVVYLTHLVKVRGVEAGLKPASTAGPYCDSDAAVDGAGEDEATVVVRVLSNKVHATRGAGYKSGFLAELLSVRPCCPLFYLSQHRCLLVTVGMVLHPGPGVGDHGLQFRLLGFPVEVGLDLLARGHERRRVPRPPRRLDGVYTLACDEAGGFDYLPDGETSSVAQVVDAVLSWFGRLECQQMGAAEVFDVDVVAHGGAVARRVVGAEDLHGRALRRGPENEGDQVRLRMVVLPEPSARPRHVEVAEARRCQPTSPAYGADEPVHGELGASVRVGRQGWSCLLYRHLLGLPVDSGRRRKDEPPCTRFAHRLQEVERPADVVAVVALGLLHRLSDEGERGEVEHAVEALGERLAGESGIHEVSLDQACSFRDGLSVSFAEVVEHDRLVTRCDELGGDDATYVAGPAGYKDLHGPSIFPRRVSAVLSGRTSIM